MNDAQFRQIFPDPGPLSSKVYQLLHELAQLYQSGPMLVLSILVEARSWASVLIERLSTEINAGNIQINEESTQ